LNSIYHDTVSLFYARALSVNANASSTEVLNKILADNFQSRNGQETKDKATLTKQIAFFWQIIPDLKWDVQEFIIEGNRCVVRSVATGSPTGNFMGIDLDGSKSFKIDTIDIHTVENGQIVAVYHLEDWATAMKQLRS
jgi:predicted ester cyclase